MVQRGRVRSIYRILTGAWIIIAAVVLVMTAIPASVYAAGQAGCCVYLDASPDGDEDGKTIGCLDVVTPNGTDMDADDSTGKFCSGAQVDGQSLFPLLQPGACSAETNSGADFWSCFAPNGAPEHVSAFKTQIKDPWDDKFYCHYKSNTVDSDGHSGVGCKQFSKTNLDLIDHDYTCPQIPGYTVTQYPGLEKEAVCQQDYSGGFAVGFHLAYAEQEKQQLAVGVTDEILCCAKYTDTNGNDVVNNGELISCTPPKDLPFGRVCDKIDPENKVKLQLLTAECSTQLACQKAASCCVVFTDADGDHNLEDGEPVLQCSNAAAGCGTAFLEQHGFKNEAGMPNRVEIVQGTLCNEISACGSVTLNEEQANQQFTTGSEQQKDSLTIDNTPESDKHWTKKQCEDRGYQWAPPSNNKNAKEGPYCFVNGEATLNIPIAGTTTTNISGYVGAVFQYSLGFLAIVSVISIAAAGMQWAGAAGNAAAITGAKGIILGSVVAMGVGAGGYGLLQTVNPALTRFETPPIPAVLNQNVDLSNFIGEDRVCCKSDNFCTQIRIPGGLPKEKVDEIKNNCRLMTGGGEICRPVGPLGDACRKLGGECLQRPDVDPKTQGACSAFLSLALPGVQVAVEVLAEAVLGGASFFVELGIPVFTNGKVVLNPALSVRMATEEWRSMIPGQGPIGFCWKQPTSGSLANGQRCQSNDQCASDLCVALMDTQGCFVNKIHGVCDAGEKLDYCHPLNFSLEEGVNVVTNVKSTCDPGLSCSFTEAKGGRRFECSDGSIGASCGGYQTKNCHKLKPFYEQQVVAKRKEVQDWIDSNKSLLEQHAAYQDYIDLAYVGSTLSQKLIKLQAVLGAVNAVAEIVGIQGSQLTAELRVLEVQAANTPADLEDCEVTDFGPDSSICNAGLSCLDVGTTLAGKSYRCVPPPNESSAFGDTYAEGTPCGSEINTCKVGVSAGLLTCQGISVSTGLGWCSKETWDSPCKELKGYEFTEDNTYKLTYAGSCKLLKKSVGDVPGGGKPVCYKENLSDEFGKCAYAKKSGKTTAKVYLSNDDDNFVTTPLVFTETWGSICTRDATGNPSITNEDGIIYSHAPSQCDEIHLTEKWKGTLAAKGLSNSDATPVCWNTVSLSGLAGACGMLIGNEVYE